MSVPSHPYIHTHTVNSLFQREKEREKEKTLEIELMWIDKSLHCFYPSPKVMFSHSLLMSIHPMSMNILKWAFSSLSLYIYIHMHICWCEYVCVNIYVCVDRCVDIWMRRHWHQRMLVTSSLCNRTKRNGMYSYPHIRWSWCHIKLCLWHTHTYIYISVYIHTISSNLSFFSLFFLHFSSVFLSLNKFKIIYVNRIRWNLKTNKQTNKQQILNWSFNFDFEFWFWVLSFEFRTQENLQKRMELRWER